MVTDQLEVGANYAFLIRTVPDKSFVLTDTPRHKAFLHADWMPLDGLSVIPSVEIGGKRRLARATSSSIYFDGGNYTVANLKVSYKISENLEAEAGANNLFDANYKLSDGYHEAGRNYFTNVRMTF